MRNLKLLTTKSVDLKKGDELIKVVCAKPDQDSTYALRIYREGGSLKCEVIVVEQNGAEPIKLVHEFSTEQVSEFLNPVTSLKKIYYCSAVNALLIASDAGGFYQFDLQSKEFTELFVAPSGISDFDLSLDSRLLGVTTKEETFILFSYPPNVEILNNVELGPQRSADADEKVYQTSVCWREDSKYVAVNYFDGEKRRVKIFDEAGNSHSDHEDTVRIKNACLDWQSVDGLIGTVAQTPTAFQNVTFFELNGLKRSDFELHQVEEEIVALKWNPLADILAIQRKTKVELWVRANYAWMLKRVIHGDQSSLFVAWDNSDPYKVHILWENAQYMTVEVAFTYTTALAGGASIGASVNGPHVFITPFRDNCAPPPKCWTMIETSNNVAEVIVSQFWEGVVLVDYKGTLSFYRLQSGGFGKVAVAECATSNVNMSSCHSWCWSNPSEISCLSGGMLHTFVLENCGFLDSTAEPTSPLTVVLKSSLKVRGRQIVPIYCNGSKNSTFLLVQKLCGALLLQEMHCPNNELLGRMPKTVSHLHYFVTQETISPGSLLVLGMDAPTKSIHVLDNGVSSKVLSDCVSTGIFESYYLVTTMGGQLEVIGKEELQNAIKSEGKLEASKNRYSRKVEKGSHIVTCCWNRVLEPSLTLQIIPRGNLETVSPRPLMYDSIGVLLNNEKYNEVMLAMRRHRLDFNVLAKKVKALCRPESLEMDLKSRLKALAVGNVDPHTLVLFLTDLNEENEDCVRLLKDVFDELLKADQLPEKLINPYLAVTARMKLLEEALASPLISGADIPRETIKSRIKFLGFYCDNTERLYEAALGTYDLSLASLVADCLNKDPKEYVPVMDEYRSLSTMKQKFSIDHNLKRYARATETLLNDQNSSSEEVMKYVQRHRTFVAAIKHLQSSESVSGHREESLLAKIYQAYGEELLAQGKHSEAAVSYQRGKDLSKAAHCYAQAGDWNSSVAVVDRMDKDEQPVAFKQVIQELENLKEYQGAARIAELSLDTHSALEYYARSKDWASAYRISRRSDENSSCAVQFLKDLLAGYNDLIERFETMHKDFLHYGSRYKLILEKRAQAIAEGIQDGDNFSDTESLASSTWSSRGSGVSSSIQSGKTYRSGKNARKLKRKVCSLKEGSRFEDVAIRILFWDTCASLVLDVKPEVESMVGALWAIRNDAEALHLTEKFEAVLKTADNQVQLVWVEVLPLQESVEMKYSVPPPYWTTKWNSATLFR